SVSAPRAAVPAVAPCGRSSRSTSRREPPPPPGAALRCGGGLRPAGRRRRASAPPVGVGGSRRASGGPPVKPAACARRRPGTPGPRISPLSHASGQRRRIEFMTQPHMNKTALITGASRGLGRSTALHLARAGVAVVGTYVAAKDAADSLVAEVQAVGGQAVMLEL